VALLPTRASPSGRALDQARREKEVLLAYEQDGQRLDQEGPRLPLPGGIFGGRYVTGVVSVALVRVTG
jgi:hypothetical protein